MRKKFLQHPDQIPFLQKFRMVCHKRLLKKLYMLIKREYFRFFKTSQNVGWNRIKCIERVEASKSHIESGVGNHTLEIYAALSTAFMPIA